MQHFALCNNEHENNFTVWVAPRFAIFITMNLNTTQARVSPATT